jgi:hypothetical protein
MARQKNGMSKSDEIRLLLKENPDMGAKDVVAALDKKGISVSDNLVYFVKGELTGQKHRKKKARKMMANVTEAMGNTAAGSSPVTRTDVVSTILKVKSLASEVGGLKKLMSLVEALSH